MRDTFVRTLIALAKEDPNIELMTGDLGFGVLKPFWEQLPDQFEYFLVVVNILFRVCHSCRKCGRCALRHSSIRIFSNLIKILLHIAGNGY